MFEEKKTRLHLFVYQNFVFFDCKKEKKMTASLPGRRRTITHRTMHKNCRASQPASEPEEEKLNNKKMTQGLLWYYIYIYYICDWLIDLPRYEMKCVWWTCTQSPCLLAFNRLCTYYIVVVGVKHRVGKGREFERLFGQKKRQDTHLTNAILCLCVPFLLLHFSIRFVLGTSIQHWY